MTCLGIAQEFTMLDMLLVLARLPYIPLERGILVGITVNSSIYRSVLVT